jgi:protease-4
VAAFLLIATAVAADPRFRADDGNIWHLVDNPALPAAGDAVSLGFAVTPFNKSWDKGTREFLAASPLLSLDYVDDPTGSVLRFGAALGLGGGWSVGYRGDHGSATSQNFGALWRPFDFLSTALTLDDAWNTRVWGAGVALRPLALWRARSDWLTLTGDFGWGTSHEQRWGARLALSGSDLRAWYDADARSTGFEVTVALGPSESSFTTSRYGQALKWSPSQPSLVPVILRVRMPDLLSSPLPDAPFVPRSPNLPDLLSLLDRAAHDGQVVAVAFENPPSAGGLAGAEELAGAIKRLRAAGKKVYVQADGYYDSLAFQGWVTAADRVSLDPTGALMLTAGQSRRLYFKDFLDKIGIKFVNLAPWDTKSANNPLSFSSMPEGERAMLTRFLTDRDALAADALTQGRADRLKAPARDVVGDGPYLSARQALDNGLVDTLENRFEFEDFLKKTHSGAMLTDSLPEPAPAWGRTVARHVAVVHLSGDILPGAGQAGVTIGRAAAEAVAQLREDGSVSALILRVDSPGGAVQPSDELSAEVKRTVAAGKPVVVVMGNVAASGGYYISAPASRIFAEPGTLTGSIGVTAALLAAPKALEMLGIKADGVDMAHSSSFIDWTREPTEQQLKKWNSWILETYDRFLDVVAEGRHIAKDKLEPLARGQIYTGREALALGFVDELGGQAEAQAWLEKELHGPVELTDVIPGESSFLGRLAAPLVTSMVSASDSPTLKLAQSLDRWSAPWAKAVAGIAERGGGPLVWCDLP